MTKETLSYEKNYKVLKEISEELSKQEASIDSIISKGKKAVEAARNCLTILKEEKGNFVKLEEELSALTEEVEDFMEEEDE